MVLKHQGHGSIHGATPRQAAAIRKLVRASVAQVEHVELESVRPVLKVLMEARTELRADLLAWMKKVGDPEERFTAHQMRVMLRSLEGAIDALGIRLSQILENRRAPATRLDKALVDGLRSGSHAVGHISIKSLEQEILRLGHVFGEKLIGPQLDTAVILTRGDQLLFKRYASSAARYAGDVGEDLKFQLSVGVARGETFEQLVQRLRRLGGPTGPVPVRGIFGHTNAIVEDIPEGLFNRYRFWADRIVRTEMMNAYNVQHREGIRELNEGRAEGEAAYLRRWDATVDSKVCPVCKFLDGKTAPIGGMFPDGYDHPPAHPCCRCVEIAWREDWPQIGALAEAA